MRSTALLFRTWGILWPTFIVACLLEAVVFAALDPASLSFFADRSVAWRRNATYTFVFFGLWTVVTGWVVAMRFLTGRDTTGEAHAQRIDRRGPTDGTVDR